MPAKKTRPAAPPMPRDATRVVPGGVGNSPLDDLRSVMASSPGAVLRDQPPPYDWGNPLPVARPLSGANPPAPATGLPAAIALQQAGLHPIDDGVTPAMTPEEEVAQNAAIQRELDDFDAQQAKRKQKRSQR